MNRYLIILIGKNYVKPFNVLGDEDKITKLLSEESSRNTYLYLIYEWDYHFDCYCPWISIVRGVVSHLSNNIASGVIFDV